MREMYINSNLNPLTAATEAELWKSLMEHLSNNHEDRPNQHEKSYKLCNDTGHPTFSLMKSHWKLKQHDQNFPIEGKPL